MSTILSKKGDFSKIVLSLASPEYYLNLSCGEVVIPETINYKTSRAEFGGLFCERIFGPTRDYMCFCEKYKGKRYRGIICDECGVEVTTKKTRRERWGHIVLAMPVANILFFKQVPSKISGLLGIPYSSLMKIIYFESYIVIRPGIKAADGLRRFDLLSIEEYDRIYSELPEANKELNMYHPEKFIAKTGASAIYDLLCQVDLDALYIDIKEKMKEATSEDRNNLSARLKLVRSFIRSREVNENRPEWMIFKILPVMPADLRPLMIIDGTVTTVDLNELYKSVLISNNRLIKLINLNAPEVILRNAKILLQKAVDNLIDNSGTTTYNNERKLKSLTELIKGKEGRFRQNLLGKRVDYSGRSVIVINPKLKIYECGVPKGMAVELFKPMIINGLVKRKVVNNTEEAEDVIKRTDPIIFDILEKLIKGYPVLLNRAPTLHRMNIQAFQPRLVDGEAIELNPLVCSQFNADFDGDQMAIHIPLTLDSRLESSTLLLAGNNILKTSDGTPCFLPIQDIILGLYYLTIEEKESDNEGEKKYLTFDKINNVLVALNCNVLKLHSKIKFLKRHSNCSSKCNCDKNNKKNNEYIITTVGRVIFNSYLPEHWDFINENITKNNLKNIILKYSREMDNQSTVEFLDNIKDLGFNYSYVSGLSFKVSDIFVPENKQQIINKAINSINLINRKYNEGFISDKGRYNQVLDTWSRASVELSNKLVSIYKNNSFDYNSIYLMLISGARGSWEQLKQIGAMKGLISKSQKDSSTDSFSIIEYPITSNFKEGLDVFEYFISTYGGRKGMTDTALKTANAGYLTRKLVDVVHDVVITSYDCGTQREYCISTEDFIDNNTSNFWELYKRNIIDRVSSREIKDIKTNEIIVRKNEIITSDKAVKIVECNIDKVYVRSVLTCNNEDNLCSLCYGKNLSNDTMSQVGDSVGVIAAQSIGEPGTQLTLNTFHFGGIATSSTVKSSISSSVEGVVEISKYNSIVNDGREIVISNFCKMNILHPITSFVLVQYNVTYGSNLYVKSGDKVKVGDTLFDWDPYFSIKYSQYDGEIIYENFEGNVTLKEEKNNLTGKTEYIVFDIKNKNKTYLVLKNKTNENRINVSLKSRIFFKNGDKVKYGDVLIKTPKILSQATDITGGLPRVSDLFEAKKKTNPSILSEIDGIVKITNQDKNKINVTVTSNIDDYSCKYSIPVNSDLLIQDGDIIKHGEKLNVGEIDVSDILRTCGYFYTCKYLVEELKKVYSLQGIMIKEKHIEIIIKQMLSFVEIVDEGDTDFIVGEVVKRTEFINKNINVGGKYIITNHGDSEKYKNYMLVNISEIFFENMYLKSKNLKVMEYRKTKQARAKIIVRGISQVSLSAPGFLSPASFQSTISVLNQAAISSTVDELKGIKANVIVGKKIHAGTGMDRLSNFEVKASLNDTVMS